MKYVTALYLPIIALLLIAPIPAKADDTAFIVDLPLYDSPYNTDFDAINPSMTQALQFSKAFYQFSHFHIQSFWGANTDATLISIILFDTLATWLPLSNGWLHEEWHRSVMGQYGIKSRNDIYELKLFEETISVSNVSDADLIALKKNHPADLIRLHTAGLESQNQLNLSIENDQFFEDTQTHDALLLWFNSINTTSYLNTCSSDESTHITNKILANEGQSISDRDFTGLDCNAWVYDLFRPNEPYADRGTHPSGNGFDRYITYEKLGSDERQYLRKQYYLSFLNFVDPFLLNKHFFAYKYSNSASDEHMPILWNANIKHYLTPFGYTINLHAFIKMPKHSFLFTLNNHFNKNHHFSGVGADVINLPLRLGTLKLASTIKMRLWQQPRQFSFTTASADTGASLSTRVEYKLTRKLGTYLDISHKTSGWLEGNVYLNSSSSILMGLRFRA